MNSRPCRFFSKVVKRWNSNRYHRRRRARKGLRSLVAAAFGAASLMGMLTFARAEEPVDVSTAAVVAPATEMDEVVVTGENGYKADNASLHKYTQPLRDTPQSVTVVPQKLMKDQGTTTLRDALRNAPGISLGAGEAGAQGDNLTIRGFSARSDIFMDGMRDFGSYYRDPFNQEQVEVLQGPASVTFGRGSTGGIVNQDSKVPKADPFVAANLAVGTDATQRATADVNTPLPELGRHTSFRLNLMSHESRVAGRDVAQNRRTGFAPSLSFGLGTPARLTLSYFHLHEDDIPDYGIPFLFDKPAPVERSVYYGFRDGNYLRADANVGTAKAEVDVNDHVTLRNQARLASYDRAARITEPQVPTSVNLATPLESINVTRNQITTDSTETFFQDQLDAVFKFDTGFIGHTVVTGLEGGQETSNPQRSTYTVATTSLLHPNEGQIFAGTGSVSSRVDTKANSWAAYLLETAKIGRFFDLIGGVRYDRFDARFMQTTPAFVSLARTDTFVSWRGALVYKPVETGSLYVSYGTSFNPSAEQLSLAANTSQLDPEKSRVYEAGTKWDLFRKRLAVSGAVFRDEKVNARTPDPTNATLNILDGDQRVDGFQLGLNGSLTRHWELFSGYAYLDSEIIKSGRPAEVGQRIANTPKHTANVWSTYELPHGLSLGGGADIVTSRVASTTAPDPVTGRTKTVGGYTVYNAMVKWQVSPRLGLQLNGYNLTDRYYIDTIHPAHIVAGAGRSALLTTNVTF